MTAAKPKATGALEAHQQPSKMARSLNPLNPLTGKEPQAHEGFKEFNDFKNPEELLAALNHAGFRLWVEGDALRWRGPGGVLTDRQRNAIRAHKAELLALLEKGSSANSPDKEERRTAPASKGAAYDAALAAMYARLNHTLTPEQRENLLSYAHAAVAAKPVADRGEKPERSAVAHDTPQTLDTNH